jgi:hypothetical protein
MTFIAIFDAGQQGYLNLLGVMPGLIVVAVGIVLELNPHLMRFFVSAPGFWDAGKRIFNRAVLTGSNIARRRRAPPPNLPSRPLQSPQEQRPHIRMSIWTASPVEPAPRHPNLMATNAVKLPCHVVRC